jgi:hypothetical protein
MQDFNPLDLSAPKKVDVQTAQEAPAVKATVHRVSMGPLFHSRITRVIAFILSIVLAGLIGYAGMNYYLTTEASKGLSVLSTKI